VEVLVVVLVEVVVDSIVAATLVRVCVVSCRDVTVRVEVCVPVMIVVEVTVRDCVGGSLPNKQAKINGLAKCSEFDVSSTKHNGMIRVFFLPQATIEESVSNLPLRLLRNVGIAVVCGVSEDMVSVNVVVSVVVTIL